MQKQSAQKTSEKFTSNQKQVYQLLKQLGYTDNQIAGIMANISVQTGGTFDYKTKQKNGPGQGLFQLDFKKKDYKEFLLKNNMDDSAKAQIQFMHSTIRGQNKKVIGAGNANKINKTFKEGDLKQITQCFCKIWQKPSAPHMERRLSESQKYSKLINKLNVNSEKQGYDFLSDQILSQTKNLLNYRDSLMPELESNNTYQPAESNKFLIDLIRNSSSNDKFKVNNNQNNLLSTLNKTSGVNLSSGNILSDNFNFNRNVGKFESPITSTREATRTCIPENILGSSSFSNHTSNIFDRGSSNKFEGLSSNIFERGNSTNSICSSLGQQLSSGFGSHSNFARGNQIGSIASSFSHGDRHDWEKLGGSSEGIEKSSSNGGCQMM